MRVVILGCGPTGLTAAQAAWDAGADEVEIISKKRKSEMFGAQYLHEPIPGFEWVRSATISYRLEGTMEGYRKKVYGPDYTGTVSPSDYEGDHKAFDIRETYDALWGAWESSITEAELTPSSLANMLVKSGEDDLFINTIPMRALCSQGHTFAAQRVWAMGDAPERGVAVPFKLPPQQVLCNGEDAPSWYRLSNIFNYKTVEWPERSRPPLPCAEVAKPLYNNCTCFPTVARIGRYGMWQKGVLVHHSYMMAHDITTGALPIAATRWHKAECPFAPESGVSPETAMMMGCRCE